MIGPPPHTHRRSPDGDPTMKRHRLSLAVLTALALVLGSTSSALALPLLTVGPNVDISQFADNEAETTVAVNPTNPRNIVVISNFQRSDGLMRSVSFDAGTTWTASAIADGSDDLGEACCD